MFLPYRFADELRAEGLFVLAVWSAVADGRKRGASDASSFRPPPAARWTRFRQLIWVPSLQ